MFNKISAMMILVMFSMTTQAYDRPEKPVQDDYDKHMNYVRDMLIHEAMVSRKHNKQTHFQAKVDNGTFRFYPYQFCEVFNNPGDFQHHGTFTNSYTGKVYKGCWDDGYYVEFRHKEGIEKVPQDKIKVVNPAMD